MKYLTNNFEKEINDTYEDYVILANLDNALDSKNKAEWILSQDNLVPANFTFIFDKTVDMYEDTNEFRTMDLLIKYLIFEGFKVKFPEVQVHKVSTLEEADSKVVTDTLGLKLSDRGSRGFRVVEDEHRKHPKRTIQMPHRGSKHSAGYDFYSPVDFTLKPGERIKVATDVCAFMLPDEYLQVHVRSSIGIKGVMITNTTGIVDSDYYKNPKNGGNILVFLHNVGDETLEVEAGDRIAQGIFSKYLLIEDDDLNSGVTRTGGYGHTGK